MVSASLLVGGGELVMIILFEIATPEKGIGLIFAILN